MKLFYYFVVENLGISIPRYDSYDDFHSENLQVDSRKISGRGRRVDMIFGTEPSQRALKNDRASASDYRSIVSTWRKRNVSRFG